MNCIQYEDADAGDEESGLIAVRRGEVGIVPRVGDEVRFQFVADCDEETRQACGIKWKVCEIAHRINLIAGDCGIHTVHVLCRKCES